MASTNFKERDLFLENEILFDDEGNIIDVLEGIWITRDEMSFFKVIPYQNIDTILKEVKK